MGVSMAQYVKSVLLKDEEIIFSTSLHWIIFLQGTVVLAIAGLLSLFAPAIMAMMYGPNVIEEFREFYVRGVLIVTTIGVVLLLIEYIKQISTELAVTNRRVIAKFGFISRTTYELFLDKVEGANVDQTILGRLFGFGSVLVKGTGGGISPIHNVNAPVDFQKHLLGQVNKVKK